MPTIEWSRSGQSVLRLDKWRIVRFPWSTGPHYILWHGEEYRGTYSTAEDAKKEATASNL